jgi:hypothetical protein
VPASTTVRKIGVSVTHEDFAVLSQRAKRLHGGNLSRVIKDMAEAIRRDEAAERVLVRLGGNRVTEQEMQAIRDDVSAATAPVRSKRVRAA